MLCLFLTRWQQVRPNDGDLNLHPTDADESVDDKEEDGTDGEVLEEGRLDESPGPVKHHQDEEDRPHVVRDPEGTEGVTPGVLHGERVHDEDEDREKYARESYNTPIVCTTPPAIAAASLHQHQQP